MWKIIQNITDNILSYSWVQYTITTIFYTIVSFIVIFLIKLLYRSYKISNKTQYKTSWIKIIKDIGYTMYTWSNKENDFVLSLPRLMYFISMVLIVYVVISDKTDMLPPLLGFNISAMISYLGGKSLDAHNKRGDYSDGTIEDEEILPDTDITNNPLANKIIEIANNFKDKMNSKEEDE